MNYLAHAFFADPTPASLLGSLMGDFVKGPLHERYAADVRRAIALHRRIDAITDAHPVTLASRARMAASHRRFAGIIIDVAYDHFLARHWTDYARVPLAAFVAEVYAALQCQQAVMPERMQRVVPRMIAQDWLASYRELDSIDAAFKGISKRLSRPNTLASAIDEVTRNYGDLCADFRAFFPDLIVKVERCKAALPAP